MKSNAKQVFKDGGTHQPQTIEDTLKALSKTLNEKYPCGVPRKEIGRATGNVCHPRTCANLDSLGEGISGRFKIGRNTVYPVQAVVDFIKTKTTAVAAQQGGNYE